MTDSSGSPLPTHMFYVLLVLNERPMHGYGIKKAVVERSRGSVELDPGGLYRMIARLEERGWAEPVPTPAPESDSRRKYYGLTLEGRAALRLEARRLWSLAHDPEVTALARLGLGEAPGAEEA